jgi:hypothetical protein
VTKLFSLLSRAPHVGAEEFHDHWRHPHGTFGRLIPVSRSYVQSHRIPCDLLGAEDHDGVDGVAEAVFDSLADALGVSQEHQYTAYVQPDEPAFVDLTRMQWLFADEEVLVSRRAAVGDPHGDADALWSHLDRPTSVKLLQFVRPGGAPGWAGPRDAELGDRIGALRHVRNHAVAEAHPDGAAFAGVRELWWPTVTAFRDGVAKDEPAFHELLDGAGAAVTLLAQAERYLR